MPMAMAMQMPPRQPRTSTSRHTACANHTTSPLFRNCNCNGTTRSINHTPHRARTRTRRPTCHRRNSSCSRQSRRRRCSSTGRTRHAITTIQLRQAIRPRESRTSKSGTGVKLMRTSCSRRRWEIDEDFFENDEAAWIGEDRGWCGAEGEREDEKGDYFDDYGFGCCGCGCG